MLIYLGGAGDHPVRRRHQETRQTARYLGIAQDDHDPSNLIMVLIK